jgi:DNA-binding response OmpR family regulator
MAIIAVVEDTPEHSDFLVAALRQANHVVHLFSTEASAIEALSRRHFDAIILDMKLDNDRYAGFRVLQQISISDRSLVMIISEEQDVGTFRPLMLNAGAWDYVPKPIEADTLVIKVDRLLKGALQVSAAPQTRGSLRWDPQERCKMRWKGQEVSIPETPYAIVRKLAEAEGRAVSFNELFDELGTRTKENLFSQIKNARQAFKVVDADFDAIRTVPGKGYSWSES